MIVKLVVNLFIVALIVLFFGLNFDTKIDLHFWFNDRFTLKEVSVFIALMAAFLLGAVSTIPIYLLSSFRKKKKQNRLTIEESEESEVSE